MRDLVDVHYPKAERIRVALDNLSMHLAKNLYEAFPAEVARTIADLESEERVRQPHVAEAIQGRLLDREVVR